MSLHRFLLSWVGAGRDVSGAVGGREVVGGGGQGEGRVLNPHLTSTPVILRPLGKGRL